MSGGQYVVTVDLTVGMCQNLMHSSKCDGKSFHVTRLVGEMSYASPAGCSNLRVYMYATAEIHTRDACPPSVLSKAIDNVAGLPMHSIHNAWGPCESLSN